MRSNIRRNIANTRHVPRPVDCSKAQSLRTPRKTRPSLGEVAANSPRPQRLRRKLRLPAPLERQRPAFVAHPVADPIVCPYVDEHAHATLEQAADVVGRRGGEAVELCAKGGPDGGRTGGEVCGD